MAEVVEIGLAEAKAANSEEMEGLNRLNNIRQTFSAKLSAHLSGHFSGQIDKHLWRASDLQQQQAAVQATTPSGFANLDQYLAGSGWPEAGLAELLCTTTGVGELRLLIPALKRLSQQSRWIAWVNPPFVPYAPALAALAIDTSKILLIHPKTHKEALWATEQAIKSGTCSTVLTWLDETKLKPTDTQRLQLASKAGKTLAFLFRPESAAAKHSMAELRLSVQPQPSTQCDELNLSIIKRRGGWPINDLAITLQQTPIRQPLHEIKQQLTLWRSFKEKRSFKEEQAPKAKQALPLSTLNNKNQQLSVTSQVTVH